MIQKVILALKKKSNIFILREICKRTHCPSIVTLALLLFIYRILWLAWLVYKEPRIILQGLKVLKTKHKLILVLCSPKYHGKMPIQKTYLLRLSMNMLTALWNIIDNKVDIFKIFSFESICLHSTKISNSSPQTYPKWPLVDAHSRLLWTRGS